MFKGLINSTLYKTNTGYYSTVAEQIHRKPPQLEQLSNSYCNGGLNIWSNIGRFAFFNACMSPYTPCTHSTPYIPYTPYISYTHLINSLHDCYIGIHDRLQVGEEWERSGRGCVGCV